MFLFVFCEQRRVTLFSSPEDRKEFCLADNIGFSKLSVYNPYLKERLLFFSFTI